MNFSKIAAVLAACFVGMVSACPEAQISAAADAVTFSIDGTPIQGLTTGQGVHVVTLNPYSMAVIDNNVYTGAGAGLPAFIDGVEADAIVLVGATTLTNLNDQAILALANVGAMMADNAANGAYALVGRRGDGTPQLDATESTAASLVLKGVMACKGSTQASPAGCPVNFELVNGISCQECALQGKLGAGGFAPCVEPTCAFYNPAANNAFSTGGNLFDVIVDGDLNLVEDGPDGSMDADAVARAAGIAAVCGGMLDGSFTPVPVPGLSDDAVVSLLEAFCAAEDGLDFVANAELSSFVFTPEQMEEIDTLLNGADDIAIVGDAEAEDDNNEAAEATDDAATWLTLSNIYGVKSVGIASTWACYNVQDAASVLSSPFSGEVVLFGNVDCDGGSATDSLLLTIPCTVA